ncbi:unnamed protein product [Rhizophagus irregularis]|nr:unnamed protein product [Rhizophagus irregularis]
MLENIISEWIRCIDKFYETNRDGNYVYRVLNIDDQLKNDMLEFVKANKALVQEQVNTSIIHLIHKHIIQVEMFSEEIEKSKNVSEVLFKNILIW